MLKSLRENKIKRHRREYKFHPTRRWRFDFAWPKDMVALEVEGGIYSRGRHTTPKGMIADACKYNEAALLGWTVVRVMACHIKSGEAIEWVKRALLDK